MTEPKPPRIRQCSLCGRTKDLWNKVEILQLYLVTKKGPEVLPGVYVIVMSDFPVCNRCYAHLEAEGRIKEMPDEDYSATPLGEAGAPHRYSGGHDFGDGQDDCLPPRGQRRGGGIPNQPPGEVLQ